MNAPIPRFILAVLVFCLGLALLLFPQRAAARSARAHARRLADREARGTDAYFEEARALRAYSPRLPWMWRVTGAIFAAAGAFLILDPITR